MDYKKWAWEYLDAAGKVAQAIARKKKLLKELPEERGRLTGEIESLTKVHRYLKEIAFTLERKKISDD